VGLSDVLQMQAERAGRRPEARGWKPVRAEIARIASSVHDSRPERARPEADLFRAL
nr:hypothetical protein [Tanacetum cinerariifolium]